MDKKLLLHLLEKKRDIDARGAQLSKEVQIWAQDLKNLVGDGIFGQSGVDWATVCHRLLTAEVDDGQVSPGLSV